MLPERFQNAYKQRRQAIRSRLAEFDKVRQEEWFYETAFCLLTPQSKAVNADAVIRILQEAGFRDAPFDPVEILREPSHYIRFHRVKADRLLWLQANWKHIEPLLASARHLSRQQGCRERRDDLAASVHGMGLKEASHVLRNIGCRGLAIIDRHLIRCLIDCGVIPNRETHLSLKTYHEIEERFDLYGQQVGIDMDELDLLFWSEISGLILK